MRLCFRDYSGNVLNRVSVTGIDTPSETFRTLGAIRDWNLVGQLDGEAIYAPAGVGRPPWADELFPPDPTSTPKNPSRGADHAESQTKIPREVEQH